MILDEMAVYVIHNKTDRADIEGSILKMKTGEGEWERGRKGVEVQGDRGQIFIIP